MIKSLRPHPVLHRLQGICLFLAVFSLSAFSAANSAELSLTSSCAKQGQPVEVTYTTETAENSPSFIFGRQTYKLFPAPAEAPEGESKHIYKAILSPSLELDPGVYTLKNDSASVKLKVLDGKFYTQYMSLPPAKNNFNMSPGEEAAVDGAKATASAERFWTGNFVRPSKARVSSAFGNRRVVNGKLLKDYFHSGLDFAGYQGSPVVACAPGIVVLAATGFKLHGNCIAIDHGQGVVSFYIHLKKLNVVQGQKVKAGELIGQIGQTGRANGPHLHFSIYCNKAASNPNYWFANAIK
ncbi:MAG: M23 family metallopeptidase [Candidatus Melainabacteria bacterium]|nr:M23 family metallopeptidase [Candidatus Melainabacteria bacterium]